MLHFSGDVDGCTLRHLYVIRSAASKQQRPRKRDLPFTNKNKTKTESKYAKRKCIHCQWQSRRTLCFSTNRGRLVHALFRSLLEHFSFRPEESCPRKKNKYVTQFVCVPNTPTTK